MALTKISLTNLASDTTELIGNIAVVLKAKSRVEIPAGTTKLVPTGVTIECDAPGVLLRAFGPGNAGAELLNAPDVPANFKGEIVAVVYNSGQGPLVIGRGHTVATLSFSG